MSGKFIVSQSVGAIASRAARSLPPFLSDCAGYHLLGGSEAASRFNRVNQSAPLDLIGTPTYGSNFAVGDYQRGFVTAESFDSHACTTIMVHTDGRNAADTAFAANSIKFMSMGPAGEIFHFCPGGSDQQFRTGTGSGVGQTFGVGGFIPTINPDNEPGCQQWNGLFRFRAGVDTGSEARLTIQDGAMLKQFTGASGLGTTSPIRFAGAGFAADSVTKIAAIAYYSRALNFAELLEVFAFIRGDLEARGIST